MATASKALRTSVRLDTKQAVSSLNQLERKIRAVQNAVNKTTTSSNKLNTAINRSVATNNKLNNGLMRVHRANQKVASSAESVNKGYQRANSTVSLLTKNVRRLISAYVGLMGVQAVLRQSDAMTSAQNKLNNNNANLLGSKGYVNGDVSQGYSQATLQATQNQMDKLYASSQKVRIGYTDMMANVSKSMILAGDAFQNSTDNAIRFQEIMAEAYTLGGASAAEMSSSMYQMIQALGAGTLAGDELRSVREGAPLAYKAIEEFAQGVYKTDESLKDLASQGKITSDMVVAAIMGAGDKLDAEFKNTTMTFAQAFTKLKNTAIYAFQPVFDMLSKALNSEQGQAFINGISTALLVLGKGIAWVMGLLGKFFTWFADNWYWIQWIVYAVATAIVIHFSVMAAQAIWTGLQMFWAFLTGLSPLYTMIIIIGLVIAALVYLANTTSSVCEFIAQAALWVAKIILMVLAVVASVYLITGTLILSTTMLIVLAIIAVIALLVALFVTKTQEVMAWVYVAGAFIVNVVQLVLNVIMTAILLVVTFIYNVVALVVNLIMVAVNVIAALIYNLGAFILNVVNGVVNWIGTACDNIGIWWSNMCAGMSAAFWNFVADTLESFSALEPAFNALASLLGLEGVTLSGTIKSARSKASSASGSIQSYKSMSNAFSEGMSTYDYKSISGAISSGWNTMDFKSFGSAVNTGMSSFGTAFEDGWFDNAYNKGYDKGTDIKNSIESFGSNVKDKLGDAKDWITDKLNLGGLLDSLPSADNPKYNVSNAYDPSKALSGTPDLNSAGGGGGGGKALKDTADNTGRMADALDLAQEDLEDLRKIANMEWINKHTTNQINVDMSNYNTINGESDLDGIVTKLTDKLYEELEAVADGVYA